MGYTKAKLALKNFLAGIGVFFSLSFANEYYGTLCNLEWIIAIYLLTAVLMCIVLKVLYHGQEFQVRHLTLFFTTCVLDVIFFQKQQLGMLFWILFIHRKNTNPFWYTILHLEIIHDMMKKSI